VNLSIGARVIHRSAHAAGDWRGSYGRANGPEQQPPPVTPLEPVAEYGRFAPRR
jgi:hypothetical protein